MKKVGIIDNYISNYHTNTYYRLFHEIAVEENREEYCITHIYAKTDVSPSTGETTAQWCERTEATACETIEEVCAAADVLMVLAPNNPEMHEELTRVPFESGKPVYVDKTFAPDVDSAKRIINYGKKFNANFWSSSATRFEPALNVFLSEEPPYADSVAVQGGNSFEVYVIHLIELMNTIMKNGAHSIICRNAGANRMFEINYEDGRKAFTTQFINTSIDFCCYVEQGEKCQVFFCKSDFWKSFARALLDYFETRRAPIPIENTLECIAIRAAMQEALRSPGEEILIEK